MIKRVLKKILPHRAILLYHRLLSHLAAAYYNNPSKQLVVIGVTGTKGKSTTTNIIAKLLEALGETTGLTSTINFKVGKEEWLNDKKMTMLGRFATQKLLSEMVRAGCAYAVVETSSEGIAQYRHETIHYDIAVFTNLSPEHLEAHGGFENYRAAKEKLFQHLSDTYRKHFWDTAIQKTIVANADDEESKRILNFAADKKITYGKNSHDITLSDIHSTGSGTAFVINGISFHSNLVGTFNAYNAAAAIATISSLGFSLERIADALTTLQPIAGRQEWIDEGQDFKVMVDYAYEPESQKQLYELLQTMNPSRIIHVTGSAGGGRDSDRRRVLGKLAADNADIVIVTDEDPYDEDPMGIINAVAGGSKESGKKEGDDLLLILDRKEAIQRAISLAKAGDLVLITGKGSEQAMCVANGKKIPWDDREIARSALKKLYGSKKN